MIRLRNLGSGLALERVGYNRTRSTFTLKCGIGEFARDGCAALLDGLFRPSGPQLMDLRLEFKGIKSAVELYEALEGLKSLLPAPVKA